MRISRHTKNAVQAAGVVPEKRSEVILIILLLFAATAVCYGAVSGAGFIWDDEYLVLRNPLLRAPLHSLQIFKQDIVNSAFTYSMYYRPLQILTYAVDYRLWGMNPLAFHLSNVFLHFLNSVLVFVLTRRLTGKNAVALLASVLFVIHPAHGGAVSYVSGRAELLFFFFGFLYMLVYMWFTERRKYILLVASVFFLGMSLLCKEAAVVFPFLLLLMGMTVLRERPGNRLVFLMPGFFLTGGYMVLHYLFFGQRYPRIFGAGGFPGMIVRYFGMVRELFIVTFFPVGLHMRRTAVIPADAMFVFALAAGCLAFLLFYLKEERGVLLFSVGFFLVALVPFVFVAGALKVFAEHWMYLPGYGIFLFTALTLHGIYNRGGIFVRCALGGVFLAGIIFYSGTTRGQNRYWRDDVSLCNRVLAFSKQDQTALQYRAVAALKGDRVPQSASDKNAYMKSASLDPAAWYLKGRLELAAGDINGAEQDFKKSLAIKQDYFDGYLGMALVSFARGEDKRGIEYLERVIEINPKHSEALLILATAYSKAGKVERALETAKKAEEINPYSYDALINLGTAYTRCGYLQEGAGYYLKAARLYPERPLAFYNLGHVFFIAGRKQEAEKWLRRAVMLDPGFTPAIGLLEKIKSD